MPLLPNKKIGGFKLVVGKKNNYRYQIVALVISAGLLAAVAYGILYASNAVTRLFEDEGGATSDAVQFDLERAQKSRWLASPAAPPGAETTPSPSQTPAATSSPSVSPSP